MKLSDFDYHLPPDRIAQRPVQPRDAARLFVHHIASDRSEHRLVRDVTDVLRAGDLLVVNDTRVRPARLCGTRPSGGAVEMLVLGPATPDQAAGEAPEEPLWRALVNPARRLRAGQPLSLEGGAIEAVPIERGVQEDGTPSGEWSFVLRGAEGQGASLEELFERVGRMPLPPYIRRGRGEDPLRELDRERYQTVYATQPGAIAAPTAGLHFTEELLRALAAGGVERASVTLHVGLGTFLPVTEDEVDDHDMHAESYVLPQATVDAIARTRERGGRVVAVGTTVTRVLEACASETGLVAGEGETRLFLRPGYTFRAVDALLTNFHLPKSTLLMLVSALAGRERMLRLYGEAVEAGYRFFSYGDAMLLL